MQSVIKLKLSAAVLVSYRVNKEKNLATVLKTILPSLPRAVEIRFTQRRCTNVSIVERCMALF